MSREGGGEGDGGYTALRVEGKGGLAPESPAAKKLGNRTVHQVLLF